MFKEISKGRILDHPVHAMLVHFPVALFPLSFAFDLWAMLSDEPDLFRASLYSICLGLAGGLAAALFGLVDYLKLTGQQELLRKASWHAAIQSCVLMIFGVITGLRFLNYPESVEPGILQLIAMGIAIAAMLAGNYLGGDLVYRHGVGVHRR